MLVACGGEEDPAAVAPPSIAVQPPSLSAESCGSVTFVVHASGTPPLRYQWLESGSPVLGATSSSYILERVGPTDSGRRFSVVVSNVAGSVRSEEATLTVLDPGGQVVLAGGTVSRLASDGTTVYWTDGLGVKSASVNCSGPIRSLYERIQAYENAIALGLAPGRIVWTDTVTGAIRSVAVGGGTSTTLASGLGPSEPYAIVVGSGRVFWPNQWSGIQTVALDGGGVATIASGRIYAGGIAVDDLYVYWTDLQDRAVKRMPLSGGDVAVLAGAQEYPNSIAADGQSVYWANATNYDTGQPTGYLMKVSRDGGIPVVLGSQPALVLGIALDASFVYWTGGLLSAGATGSGSVSRVPLDGSEPPSVLASGLDLPGDIALDLRYVYWRDSRGVVRLEK